jgi:hypothetical protein
MGKEVRWRSVVSSQRRRKEGKLLVAAARGGNIEEARVPGGLKGEEEQVGWCGGG